MKSKVLLKRIMRLERKFRQAECDHDHYAFEHVGGYDLEISNNKNEKINVDPEHLELSAGIATTYPRMQFVCLSCKLKADASMEDTKKVTELIGKKINPFGGK